MSEYNANDHLHNVTESVQRLTWQAQGVQDITGANVSDYEQISPDAGASVTLVNARQDVPFLELVNTLPPVQDGEGTPSLDNVRVLIPYTKSIIRNGSDAQPIEVDLPAAMYGGYVDYINKQIVIDIIRVRIPANKDWRITSETTPHVYFVSSGAIPNYDNVAASRYAAGENCPVIWGTAPNAGAGDVVLFGGSMTPQIEGRVYYYPPESAEIESVDDLKAFLAENPLYIYYRAKTPSVIPFDTFIPYVLDSNYSISADSGTLTVKYQGIAPDEP